MEQNKELNTDKQCDIHGVTTSLFNVKDYKKIQSLLKKASVLETKLNSICCDIANEFRPYFPDDIEVFYQPSDGFVILHNIDSNSIHSNLNTGTKEASENLLSNPNHYLDSNWR